MHMRFFIDLKIGFFKMFIIYGFDIFGICSAASTDNGRTGIDDILHLFSKVFRSVVVYGITVLIKARNTGIGFGDDRNIYNLSHCSYIGTHIFGAGRAICADGIDTKTCKSDRCCSCIASKQSSAVRFKCKSSHDGQITAFLDGDHTCSGFLNAHHGFYDKKINTAFNKRINLFFVDAY